MCMAWSQTDLDALDKAIADGRGARSISFSDQSVTFGSIDDMLKLRSVMAHEIGASGARSFRFVATSKGV